MEFIDYLNNWVKGEALQGRIMIGIGALLLFVFYSIIRSHNELLKGSLIPLGLLLLVLIGYGSYILSSRPAHAKQSIELYQQSKVEALEKEQIKHINDNRVGRTLMTYVYPGFIFLSLLLLVFASTPYYKGLAIGLILLFSATYIIDNGFVSRSDAFINYLQALNPI